MQGGGFEVEMASGRTLDTDLVVLANGADPILKIGSENLEEEFLRLKTPIFSTYIAFQSLRVRN